MSGTPRHRALVSQVLMELARARNSIPLPGIDGQGVFALPPESECLLHANYQVQLPQEPGIEPGTILSIPRLMVTSCMAVMVP